MRRYQDKFEVEDVMDVKKNIATFPISTVACQVVDAITKKCRETFNWDQVLVQKGYLDCIQEALEMSSVGMYEYKEVPVYDNATFYYRSEKKIEDIVNTIVYFPQHDIVYFNAFIDPDYSEHFIFVPSWEKLNVFIEDIEKIYRLYDRKYHSGDITIYTVEGNRGDVKTTPFQKTDENDMVIKPSLLENINNDLQTFFADTALFKRFNVAHRRGILFYGPPGTGKTLLIRYIATKANVPVIQFFASAQCDTPAFLDFFTYVEKHSPAIVVFEDLDSLFKGDLARSSFLNILDGTCTNKNLSMLLIGTTNHINEIDKAMTQRPSRFDRIYNLPFPDEDLRREYILKRFAEAEFVTKDEKLLNEFVKLTAQMSFAHLNEVYTQSALRAINRKENMFNLEDIEMAINNITDETSTKRSNVSFNQTVVGFSSLSTSAKRAVFSTNEDD